MNKQKCLENIQSILFIIIVVFLLYKFYKYYVDNNEQQENFNDINDLNHFNDNSNKKSDSPNIELLNSNVPISIPNKDIDDIEEITDKLNIKKTNKYKLVLESEEFSVWEPENIDDYFSIGQLITLDNNPPDKEAILVKSKKTVDDYELITQYKSFGIWKPILNDSNYDCI